jgi:type IV pilus assembly protein PilE
MKHAHWNRSTGFTLTELLITVAVVAILVSLTYPSYQEFVLKSRRTEAKAALMANMQLFERHFSQVNTYYVSSANQTVWSGFKTWSGDNPDSGLYAISANTACGSKNGQCVELRARPLRGDARCGTLVLDSMGVKSNILGGARTNTPDCW